MYRVLTVLLIGLFVLSTGDANAQYKRMKKKDSHSKGTLWGYWGYNRSIYTKSDIRFVGPGYDFTLAGARAHDNQANEFGTYINPATLTVPQFNIRLGYNFWENWSLSAGYDHMKYVFADQNEVFLSGKIDPNVDNVTNWSGTYNAEPVVTARKTFHYENSDGLNFLRLELTRIDRLLRLGDREQFVITSNLGLSLGGVLSYNDFTFAGSATVRTISMSGYGISAHISPRFEFFRHVFIQPIFTGGFMNQVRVKTRPNNASSYAKQKFGFMELSTVLGFFAYIRPTNGCDSCPVW